MILQLGIDLEIHWIKWLEEVIPALKSSSTEELIMPLYRMPDGENLYVRRIGRGQPVLVLSGLGMQSWQWLPLLYAA